MENHLKKPLIRSLNGLKALCVVFVFYWHSNNVYKTSIDIGARACEVLFLCSGFLFAYNYSNNTNFSLKKYIFLKLKDFYPLHLLTFLIEFIFSTKTTKILLIALLNVLLLQTWSNNIDIFFSFNGLSWFLADLLICYIFGYFYIRQCKKNTNTLVSNVLILIIIYIFRLFLEYINNYLFLGLSVHTFPIFRILEFLIGSQLFFVYELIDINKMHNFSLWELLSFALYFFSVVFCRNQNNRYIFILAFCPLLFMLCINKGILSRLLSNKLFDMFSKIQFEFFLIHLVVIKYFGGNRFLVNKNCYFVMFVNFVVTIILSIVFRNIRKFYDKKNYKLFKE